MPIRRPLRSAPVTATLLLVCAALLATCTQPHTAPQPPAHPTTTATTQASTYPAALWWHFIVDRQALLRDHAAADRAHPAPWLAPPGTDSSASMTLGNLQRTWLLHLPPAYDGKTPLPLVIALHGGGLNGDTMQYYSGLDQVADRESFIVAYPDGGVGPLESPTKPRSWDAHLNSPPDDVLFIRTLIEKLESTLPIDRSHVMVAGGSAGALMAYRYALEAGDSITAIASFCGTFAWNMRNGEPPPMPQPVAPVSILAVHGRLDNAVPYDGFETEKARVWPTNKSVAFWTACNHCSPNPIEERSPGLLKQTWTAGKNGTEVCLYSLDEGTHALPMRLSDKGPVLGSPVLWTFLSRDRACRLLPETRHFTDALALTIERNKQLPPDAQLRYTLDGTQPAASSPPLPAALTLTATATVRIRAFANGQQVGTETTQRYDKLPLRPAQNLPAPKPGLQYAYYQGAFQSLPDTSALKPTSRGTCAAPDLALVPHREQDFVIVFTGYLKAPAPDLYTLTTRSDDSSNLSIGDIRIIDNDGLHEPLDVSRSLALAQGYHPITIRYLQHDGEALLQVSIQSPGTPNRLAVPADFAHE